MPAAVAITRRDYTTAKLREAVKRTNDADAARRLLALAQVLEGKSRGEAARACGMDRQILCDWVRRYNAEGEEGLHNELRLQRGLGSPPAELVRNEPQFGWCAGGGSTWRRDPRFGHLINDQS